MISTQKLALPITIDAFSSTEDALRGQNKLWKCGLRPGQKISLFYPTIPDDKYIIFLIKKIILLI